MPLIKKKALSVAVVILNWNGKNHLKTYLPSVVAHSSSAIIYLADNHSSDDSVQFVKDNYPSIKIIQNQSNDGFAKGYNDALQHVDEEYYILLNSDVEVSENWIEPVIQFMKENKVSIAQPKILSYTEKNKFEYAGAGGGFIDVLGYPFCQGRIFQEMEEDHGQYNEIKEVFWASGACMFIKASTFHDLGGFDERYFAHMEEIDLCWRAKNKGQQVYYVPKSTVYHLGGGTMQNSNPKKTFLNFRNSLLTLYKNDTSRFTFLKIIARLVLDGVAVFKLLIESGPKHALAIIRAHFSFYASQKIKTEKTTINLKGLYKGSIAFAYFAKGQKYFYQLKKGFN